MILSEKPLIRAYNGDCMEFMKGLPDNAYDLAIVDPPYGLERLKTRHKGDKMMENKHKKMGET